MLTQTNSYGYGNTKPQAGGYTGTPDHTAHEACGPDGTDGTQHLSGLVQKTTTLGQHNVDISEGGLSQEDALRQHSEPSAPPQPPADSKASPPCSLHENPSARPADADQPNGTAIATDREHPQDIAEQLCRPSGSLPTEMWMMICRKVEGQRNLKQLARVCRHISPIAEEVLYATPVLYTPDGLHALLKTIQRTPAKAALIRSLTISWSGTKDIEADSGSWFARLMWALSLQEMSKFEHMDVFISPIVHSRFASNLALQNTCPMVLPHSLCSMNVTADILSAFTECGRGPCPPLTALSLRARFTEIPKVSRMLSQCQQTLCRLRIQRRLMRCAFQENPGRICAKLDLPYLEYLEMDDGQNSDPTVRSPLAYHETNDDSPDRW